MRFAPHYRVFNRAGGVNKGRKVNLLILKDIFLALLASLREISTYYETINFEF